MLATELPLSWYARLVKAAGSFLNWGCDHQGEMFLPLLDQRQYCVFLRLFHVCVKTAVGHSVLVIFRAILVRSLQRDFYAPAWLAVAGCTAHVVVAVRLLPTRCPDGRSHAGQVRLSCFSQEA
jgi:hypothetical protein